jgi:hypothetical protein
MACPPRKKMKGEGPSYDRKRTVFVGNLPFDVKVLFFNKLINGTHSYHRCINRNVHFFMMLFYSLSDYCMVY